MSEEKEILENDFGRKVSSKASNEALVSSGNESDDVKEEEVKVTKKSAPKKRQKSVAVKKRKRAEANIKGAKRKQSKTPKSSEGSDEEKGDVSEADNSDSPGEKPVKVRAVLFLVLLDD